MTLQELVDQLSELAENLGPDTEVRLASQPSWPLEWTIAGVSALHPQAEEIREIEDLMATTPREDWPEDAEQQLESLRSAPRVVWVCEGTQLGYTTPDHWAQYNDPSLRLWRRTEARVGVPDLPFWREGYIFEGFEVGNDTVQEFLGSSLSHARSKLEPACTPEQHAALVRVWKRQQTGLSRPDFMRSWSHTIGCDGAIVVPYDGMWLCIETDGYTHT